MTQPTSRSSVTLTALILAIAVVAGVGLGCQSPPQQTIGGGRELPDPEKYVGDWKAYKKLGILHLEKGYSRARVERKKYHFDRAIVAFNRAKGLREQALRKASTRDRPTIEREIQLIQRHLEAAYRDKPLGGGR